MEERERVGTQMSAYSKAHLGYAVTCPIIHSWGHALKSATQLINSKNQKLIDVPAAAPIYSTHHTLNSETQLRHSELSLNVRRLA